VNRFLLLAALVVGQTVLADELPVPPIPPDHPQIGESAPVPNVDARAPVAPPSNAPKVDIRQFRNRPYDPGMGFAPGSRYQSSEDRRAIQTPGLSISVPLQ
jgi:hypothetical protein